jgi:hypothetical protein
VLAETDLEAEKVIRTDLGANRRHDLEGEPRTVLERAAVLVLPVVDA